MSRKRSEVAQTIKWLNGTPEHNPETNECCPDFSCCRPELFTDDAEDRERIAAKFLAPDPMEESDT